MSCTAPVKCYRYSYPVGPNRTRPVFSNPRNREFKDVPFDLFSRRCGLCTSCRLEHARQIAVRCTHEASLHSDNCFLTLTYDDASLPMGGVIWGPDLQKFWKRLRRTGAKLKYYAAGEYGEKKSRPHFHACVFGYNFSDRVPSYKSDAGSQLYTSSTLSKIWGLGRCDIGDVTFESAAYVARYTLDKRYGKDAAKFYAENGLIPERSWSSQGLAKNWYEKFKSDIYPKDYFYLRGKRMRPPSYYDRLLLRDDPQLYDRIVSERDTFLKLNPSKNNFDIRQILNHDGSTSVMSVSEIVTLAAMQTGRVDKERS